MIMDDRNQIIYRHSRCYARFTLINLEERLNEDHSSVRNQPKFIFHYLDLYNLATKCNVYYSPHFPFVTFARPRTPLCNAMANFFIPTTPQPSAHSHAYSQSEAQVSESASVQRAIPHLIARFHLAMRMRRKKSGTVAWR